MLREILKIETVPVVHQRQPGCSAFPSKGKGQG